MSSIGLPHASLFIGIIPALLLLYISLKGYEGHYKDKTIFLTFLLGILTGFIAALIELVTLAVGVAFIILFPLLEQLFKTIILNIRRLQRKRETTIYGLSLGLGFGSIFTPVSLIATDSQLGDTWFIVVVTVIGTLGLILLHGATGVFIGYGVYDEQLMKYFIFAVLLHIPVTLWFFLTDYYNIGYLQIGVVLYGLLLYWYATKKIMSQILSQSQRRKRSSSLTNTK
jgi:hypothetical protein